jgi:hypothetical protein
MKDNLLERILKDYRGEYKFDSVLQPGNPWEVQVIYTAIDRTAGNKPQFTDHLLNVDNNRYFYPASTVKMPVAFLALQKLNELALPGLTRQTTMITEAAFPGQTVVYNDPGSKDGRPTIEQYIKKIFLVSDNDAYNRLYEFLGQEYINQNLHRLGYDSAQIVHRLSVQMTEEEHRNTNPVRFLGATGKTVYEKPATRSTLFYQPRQTFLGKGYYSGDSLVEKPFDFSKKNRLTLTDLHSILRSVMFPDAVPLKQRFRLTATDYSFLYRYMSMMPRESVFPQYNPEEYPDGYSKLLMFGGEGEMPETIRIFSKEGDAYGFLTDVAYITDLERNIEFMVSAVIHCNSDGIYNDDHYDYDTVGFPFLKHLGQAIYQYELQRKRKTIPDLFPFRIDYRQ